MPETSTFKRLRPCGRAETFSTSRHHLGFFKNVSFAATYSNPASSIPLHTLICNALRAVIARHSILSAIPFNENKSYPDVYFARLPAIDLKACVEFAEKKGHFEGDDRDKELEGVLQQQHNRNFQENLGTKPLWRLVVLHSSGDSTKFMAIWVFHHALADGSSGHVFHRTFLAALQASSTNPPVDDPTDPIVKTPETPLIPALEDLHTLPISTFFLIKALLTSIFPNWFNPRPERLWTGNAISEDPSKLNTKVRSLVLTLSATKKLLDLSRKNRTTLQATLQCILASAVLATLDGKEFERVRISGPISLRPFMRWDAGSLDDELVNGVSEYTFVHSRNSENDTDFSWDTARAVRAEIQSELDKKGNNNVVGLLRYVSDIHKYFTEKMGKDRDISVELSNVGVWKNTKGIEDGWSVGRCVFSQSPNVAGAAIPVSVVTGGDGAAVMVFTWHEGTVEDAFVEKVVRSVGDAVQRLITVESI